MAAKDLRFFDHPDAETLPDGHARRGMSVVAALSQWRWQSGGRLAARSARARGCAVASIISSRFWDRDWLRRRGGTTSRRGPLAAQWCMSSTGADRGYVSSYTWRVRGVRCPSSSANASVSAASSPRTA